MSNSRLGAPKKAEARQFVGGSPPRRPRPRPNPDDASPVSRTTVFPILRIVAPVESVDCTTRASLQTSTRVPCVCVEKFGAFASGGSTECAATPAAVQHEVGIEGLAGAIEREMHGIPRSELAEPLRAFIRRDRQPVDGQQNVADPDAGTLRRTSGDDLGDARIFVEVPHGLWTGATRSSEYSTSPASGRAAPSALECETEQHRSRADGGCQTAPAANTPRCASSVVVATAINATAASARVSTIRRASLALPWWSRSAQPLASLRHLPVRLAPDDGSRQHSRRAPPRRRRSWPPEDLRPRPTAIHRGGQCARRREARASSAVSALRAAHGSTLSAATRVRSSGVHSLSSNRRSSSLHCVLSSILGVSRARTARRALNSCPFDVPAVMPSRAPISSCV